MNRQAFERQSALLAGRPVRWDGRSLTDAERQRLHALLAARASRRAACQRRRGALSARDRGGG